MQYLSVVSASEVFVGSGTGVAVSTGWSSGSMVGVVSPARGAASENRSACISAVAVLPFPSIWTAARKSLTLFTV